VYTALLSAFSKYLLLQAETEVTAKLPTAYPLARLVWLVIARGHPKLWEIFWARWAIFCGRGLEFDDFVAGLWDEQAGGESLYISLAR
jgi:hypothetical protein